jgi:transposase
MRITYPKAIQESEEELTSLEQRLRGQKAADQVRVLRLLKSGAVKSLRILCPAGWLQWKPARALVATRSGRGVDREAQAAQASRKASKLSAEAWAGLQEEMRAAHLATMQEASNYLEREGGISYKNGKQLGWLFKQPQVKWKTRRRRPQKAHAQQQAVFKKLRAPSQAPGTQARGGLG